MKLTAASEYGCLALLAIAERHPELCKRAAIEQRFDIPSSFLEQILRRLATAGFVNSRRGSEGGFSLARPATEIIIADVIRAMDGALAPVRSVSENFYQPSPVEASAGFHALFRQVRDAVAAILEGTTLEDVVRHEQNSRSPLPVRRSSASPRRTLRSSRSPARR